MYDTGKNSAATPSKVNGPEVADSGRDALDKEATEVAKKHKLATSIGMVSTIIITIVPLRAVKVS